MNTSPNLDRDAQHCPFCGEFHKVLALPASYRASVQCINGACGIMPRTIWCGTRGQALSLWNGRAKPAKLTTESPEL